MVPPVGWAVFIAGLLAWLPQTAIQTAVFATLFVVLAPWQRTWIEMHAHAAHNMQARYQGYIDHFRSLIPPLARARESCCYRMPKGRTTRTMYVSQCGSIMAIPS